MAYKRTVRCSYCCNQGHNRSGCPDLKEYIKNNPDSWTAQRYASKKRAGSKRKCSYCKESGHNRRSCILLHKDKSTAVSLNLDWRKNAVEHMKREGWGIGALVTYSSYNGSQALGMITHVAWDKMDFRVLAENGGDEPFTFRKMSYLMSRDWTGRETFRYPPDVSGQATRPDRKFGWSTQVNVVSPLSSEAVEAQIPDGWETDTNPKEMLSNIFDDTVRYNVSDWKDTDES